MPEEKIIEAFKRQCEEIYKHTWQEIVEAVNKCGMDVVGLCEPCCGNLYLTKYSMAVMRLQGALERPAPRLILRPRPRRRILLEETEQVRVAEKGEYVSTDGGLSEPFPIVVPRTNTHYHIWTAQELKPGETV